MSQNTLNTTLADIAVRLRHDEFPNEQAISQGVVLRVLRELGWNTYDTNVVWPEYQTGDGRADFALCYPPSKPAIFIEVKHIGRAEGSAVRQALAYAFHCGVPFVVLTDGRIWSFYLPAEQGNYEDRCVCRVDLSECSPNEAVEAFFWYLAYENVGSGKSLDLARTAYRNHNRRSQAKAAIPIVWQELMRMKDNRLIKILINAVESKVGIRPDADDVGAFLGGAPPSTERPVPPLVTPQRPPRPDPPPEKALPNQLLLLGKRYNCTTGKDAMVIVLRELAVSDPLFLERCSRDPAARGRKRRYIARTAEELYPDREDLRGLHEKLPGGWLVATNLNNALKRKIVYLAAKIANLKTSEDIKLPF